MFYFYFIVFVLLQSYFFYSKSNVLTLSAILDLFILENRENVASVIDICIHIMQSFCLL